MRFWIMKYMGMLSAAFLFTTDALAAANEKAFPWPGLIFGFFAIWFVVNHKAKSIAKFEKSLAMIVGELTSEHLMTLVIKEKQSVTQDEYGNYFFDKWFTEIDYFIDNVLYRNNLVKTALDGADKEKYRVSIKLQINDAVSQYKISQIESGEHLSVDVDALDPIQYEHHCAELLRNSGWDARVTQASGDQGIDVIANYDNVKAVIQCKKYSQPVGNAAVQEIIAGKQFEQAHVAAVVTNATFTQSARQLANATGVFLLHHDELPGFAAQIGLVEDDAPS